MESGQPSQRERAAVNFLTRLVDVSFQEQEDGSVAFFPFGAAGDTYRIESPARYRHIRGFVRRFLVQVLPAVVVVALAVTLLALWTIGASGRSLLVAGGTVIAVALACGVYYRSTVRRLVAGLETTEASIEVERHLWFPTAFPELYEMHLWAIGFTALALVALSLLFPGLDDRVAGLCAGAVGVLGGWARVRGPG